MREPLFVIDGDNVAHARARLHPGAGETEVLRAGLLEAVSAWAEREGIETIVVLDGAGADRTLGRVSTAHSGALSGDAVVERLAHLHAETRAVTVVSDDRTVVDVARRGGVEAMGPRELVERMERVRADADDAPPAGERRYRLADALPSDVRRRLERLRRGKRDIS
jgi:predicted RNA-binding protein with PIN domain